MKKEDIKLDNKVKFEIDTSGKYYSRKGKGKFVELPDVVTSFQLTKNGLITFYTCEVAAVEAPGGPPVWVGVNDSLEIYERENAQTEMLTFRACNRRTTPEEFAKLFLADSGNGITLRVTINGAVTVFRGVFTEIEYLYNRGFKYEFTKESETFIEVEYPE